MVTRCPMKVALEFNMYTPSTKGGRFPVIKVQYAVEKEVLEGSENP